MKFFKSKKGIFLLIILVCILGIGIFFYYNNLNYDSEESSDKKKELDRNDYIDNRNGDVMSRASQAKFETIRAEGMEKVELAVCDLAMNIRIKLEKNKNATYTATEVEKILEQSLNNPDYKVIGQAIDINGNTASDIIVKLKNDDLIEVAKSDWSAKNKELSYSFNVSKYEVSRVIEADTNDGGY
ncbi:MAG: hypothetical protein IKF52_00010 [Clostridia bacterium]|nr:hypothetical protein [Clostridia bacterium]